MHYDISQTYTYTLALFLPNLSQLAAGNPMNWIEKSPFREYRTATYCLQEWPKAVPVLIHSESLMISYDNCAKSQYISIFIIARKYQLSFTTSLFPIGQANSSSSEDGLDNYPVQGNLVCTHPNLASLLHPLCFLRNVSLFPSQLLLY